MARHPRRRTLRQAGDLRQRRKDRQRGRLARAHRAGGTGRPAALVPVTAERWFTPAFIARHPETVEGVLARFSEVSPEGYNGCCAALAGADLRAGIGAIS